MIVEKRTYTLRPGTMAEFLAIYEAEGLPIHTKYLTMLGYFTSDIGPQNQVITLWSFDSMADREERRARLYADPAWLAVLAKTVPMVQAAENVILKPTRFSPIR
ncbi:NIPSNAP family protein [Alsobacter sp. R-9]